MQQSKLHMYSLGIVTEDRLPSSKVVRICPAEILTELNGILSPVAVDLYAAGVISTGEQYEVKISVTTSLECEWLSFDDNRASIPDIRSGEQVIIWRFGDTSKFYWTTLGRDRRLRRLESVQWLFSNISDYKEEVDELNEDNAYSMTFCTRTKQITFATNKNDGEQYAYKVQLNGKDGNATLTDDNGNYVQIDSAKDTIDSTNTCGTHYRLIGENIDVYAPDSITVEAVNSISYKCTDFSIKASNSITTETNTAKHTAKTISNNADSITNTATNITNKATTMTNSVSGTILNDCPMMINTGHVSMASFSAGGAAGAFDGVGPLVMFSSAVATIDIPLNIASPVTVTGGLTTDSISSTTWLNYPPVWDIT